jgi:DNA polymerase-3 subunit epsilon
MMTALKIATHSLHALLDGIIDLAFVDDVSIGGLSLDSRSDMHGEKTQSIRRLQPNRPPLRVIQASSKELEAHRTRLDAIDRAHNGTCIWHRLEE